MGLGAAALSFATFGPRVRKTFAQEGPAPLEILNFALTLEYLEAAYYSEGLATEGLIPEEARDTFSLIAEHEDEHVAVLVTAIEAAGGTPVGPYGFDDFDFSAGGSFPNVFAEPEEEETNRYAIYLALSQVFEDTGVRAYKGQAANIPGDLTAAGLNVLSTALQIHSIEARHAAEVRRLRAMLGADVQPWIEFNDPGGASDIENFNNKVQAAYAGEDNAIQSGFNPEFEYSTSHLTEAFDEPLTMEEVNAIAGLFTDFDGN